VPSPASLLLGTTMTEHQTNNDTPENPEPRPVHPRNSLARRKRAADVLAVYKSPDFPRALAPVLRQRGGDAVWQMLLAAIDSGLVQPNAFSPHVVNLRVLFPDGPRGYCQRFHLADPRQRNHVRDVIFPAMLATRDAKASLARCRRSYGASRASGKPERQRPIRGPIRSRTFSRDVPPTPKGDQSKTRKRSPRPAIACIRRS